MNLTKPAKDEVIRARCERSLKEQLEKVALAQHLDPSDIVRIACRTYVQKFSCTSPAQIGA